MVNAWATAASMCLAQQPTDKKSNEIRAVPELLRLLDLKGCLVSIDAIGCQREIADSIVGQGGHYLLAVKGNKEKLHDAVKELFRRKPSQNPQISKRYCPDRGRKCPW
jgi:predicted transposase YbfD/YdcC